MGQKLSWCGEHPHEYSLSSGLCTHLDCIKKIIWTHAKSWQVINQRWTYISKLGAADDCCIFLVSELLREEQEQGKKPTLNPWWLKFRLIKYIGQGLRKSDLPMNQVPTLSRKKIDQNMYSIDAIKEKHEDLLDEMVWAGSMNNRNSETPEEEYIMKEAKQKILDTFGETVLLFFTEEINKREYVRLLGVGIAPATEYSQLAKKHIKDLLLTGEWSANVDNEIKRWRETYNVTHRI